MKTDIEIARETKLKNIRDVAAQVGFPDDEVFNYGKYIAKVPYRLIDEKRVNKNHLILVTAITATKAIKVIFTWSFKNLADSMSIFYYLYKHKTDTVG